MEWCDIITYDSRQYLSSIPKPRVVALPSHFGNPALSSLSCITLQTKHKHLTTYKGNEEPLLAWLLLLQVVASPHGLWGFPLRALQK
ncbi:hypothetical protein NPIL_153491 [Nephila pilipes]|uniref:Uncharacterized protein n=1 Tax=Nephila pilipes TaxID=299642 RepID=A0A8X6U368_NEPPI|nr:hypothetical protein NPIL_153491 [Nephila pilipes]